MLLSGLPGDIESERTYHDELQTWLDLLASSGTVHKLIVLCDDPQSITIPSGLQEQTLKASRTNLLTLGPMLTDATNSVLVVAWGHGGKQGSMPVFHVRGPRITPADFQILAGQMTAARSRWILLFRGSGAFARQIANRNRPVLSSDADSAFTSDPVAMSLLLKMLKEHPTLSLKALAVAVGQATDAWYKERNLARTEEPAFWSGGTHPHFLAAEPANSLASIPEPTPPAPAAPESKEKTEPATNNLPAHWKDIARVEPQKYPDADGVILRSLVSYTLGNNPALASEKDEFIQILSAEGKRFGDFDISYTPPMEEINFQDCEVLSPAGALRRLAPDTIREGGESAPGDYHVGRRKFFSLPGVVPGAIVHVHYRTQWKTFPLPHVSMEVPIGSALAAREAEYKVSVPKDAPFHFAFEHVSAKDPTIAQTSYGTTYTWRFEDLPAYEPEILSPPHLQPRLLMSTFPDWADFAQWYGRICKLTDEMTPELTAKATELTRDAKNDREKVLRLYDYVTGLRYVAVPLGVNSFRPHSAANVLQNQFGDCKDKANLFNTMLRAIGLEANLVLVPRFSQAREDMPGLAFNHAISRLHLEDQTLWIDTTDDVCRFGMLPPGDPGRNVLVIDGKSSQLTPLPPAQPADHVLKLRGVIQCAMDSADGAQPLGLDVEAHGYPDYELRSTAGQVTHRSSLPLLAAQLRPVCGAFGLETQKATPVAALDEDFGWHGKGLWVGGASTQPGRLNLRAPFWLPKEWDLALHQRKGPLLLNQGYPLVLDEEFEFALPNGASPTELPPPSEGRHPPLQWKMEWVKDVSGKLKARLRVELTRGELALEETRPLQKQLSKLMAETGSGAAVPLRP